MIPDEKRKEGVQEHKGGAKAGVRDDCEERAEQVDRRTNREEQHGRDGAGKGEDQEQRLPVAAAVGRPGHGDDDQRLHQHADGKGVHGEAGRVDLHAEDVDHALDLFLAARASLPAVLQLHAVLSCQLLEHNGYEGACRCHGSAIPVRTLDLEAIFVPTPQMTKTSAAHP